MAASSRDQRFAGACIALGAAVLVITIVVYFAVLGGGAGGSGPDGRTTAQDAAQYILQNSSFLKAYWLIEAAALSLLMVSGFVLQSRQRSASIPTGWFWTAFGAGAAVNLVMYGYTLGIFPQAAAVVDPHPALLQSARDASYFFFFLGNALMMLGLTGVYLGETLDQERVLPRWLCVTGAAAGSIGVVGAVAGLILGPSVLPMVGPAALLATLITVVFGVQVAARR